jgi:hypothetical protein
MRKSSFVPAPDLLENRIALSGGPKFTASGAAILTSHALGEAYRGIDKAYVNFAHHGQNYQTLERSLAAAANRIPYNRRDGLLSTLASEVQGLQSSVTSGDPHPVISSLKSSLADVKEFVQSEVAAGVIAVR